MSQSSKKTTFLTLPRELRQMILFRTYETSNFIGGTFKSSFPAGGTRFVENKVSVVHCQTVENLAIAMAQCLSRTMVFNVYEELMKILGAFETWSTTLKKVHQDIVEDIEYVEGEAAKGELMAAIKNIRDWNTAF
ncbi:hypothetical protein FKW77_005100 [Venturia effusa]|uniref:Uncharacterized protein n=1 Tax=Venturia effusa TaxID=50376 RepID=A0A517LQ55_9PEZI|nr:hypothetical protein FKW77_005100 [Venturia effusa]